ncbi:hypothetical protein CH337_22040 [Rhodoblastus acidophilus]|nr:hypothetical protein CH337_22040 [Rhodoblastus acidophilus]
MWPRCHCFAAFCRARCAALRSAADLRLIADDEVERGKALIAELGLREVTGRRRYRAWGIL